MSDSNKYNFQKLTPIKNTDLSIYKEALDFIFEDDDLLNIAISGAYSSGKSSMLESYKVKHSKKRFLHISLAHFESPQIEDNDQSGNKNKDKNQTDGETAIKESVLEGKILNQLIHQIDPKRIPQTNFRTKQRVFPFRIALDAVFTALFILALLHIFMFKTWQVYVSTLSIDWLENIFLFLTKGEALFLSGFLVVFLFGICMYRTIKLQRNKGIFKKFSVQGNEIEIFGETEDSYFDKYLNEVLYLFDNANVDVVVFEDIDRFNANRIFERLREVNTLINAQRKKRAETLSSRSIKLGITKESMTYRPLRFFYLLRDDIFVSKDRTKFFDIIVPIVPVVDGSNSYDQFIVHLKDGGMLERFDQGFLQGLSLYIDDMRILNNIYNEFLVYFNRLNQIEPDFNKMMALIVYKNIFPRDFSELQLQKGFVFTIFSKKAEFILDEIKRLEHEDEEIKNQIDVVNREFLLSIEELDILFDHKRAQLRRMDPYNRPQTQKELEKIESDYSIRKKAIDNRNNTNPSALEAERAMIKEEMSRIQNKSLREIISRENSEQIFDVTSINSIKVEKKFNEVKGNDYIGLLKFLITHGHIDETYSDYMSYFYENSISITDKRFLRSITDRKAKEYSYRLKDPAKVVSKLSKHYFEQQETLNYDLMFYLLKTRGTADYLNTLFQQLKQKKNYTFIQEAFLSEHDYDIKLLVNMINSSWAEFLSEILRGVDFLESCRDDFILRTLYHTPDKDIQAINIDRCLTEHITQIPSFLNIKSPRINSLIARFKLLKIAFVSLDYDVSDRELFYAVYVNNLYELNYVNIQLMLRSMYGLEETNDFAHKNLTLIMANSEAPLSKYVWKNINQYLKIILEKCNNSIRDDELVALSVLNNKNVSEDNKVAYIDALQKKIEVLKNVKDTSLWKKLLQRDIVIRSEWNIIDYFLSNQNMLTTELVKFIDVPNVTYKFSAISQNYGGETASNFFISILKCNELSNKHYREILSSLGHVYNNGFSIDGIDADKFSVLIHIGIIKMHSDALAFIREYYPNEVLQYIKKYIKEYTEKIVTTDTIIVNEMIDVLSLDVADSYKIKLLGLTKEPVSVVDKTYSDTVKAHILKNNFDSKDILQLILQYWHGSKIIKPIIEDLAIKYKEFVIAEGHAVPVELLDKLISTDKLTRDDKIRFFAITLDELNESQCRSILRILHLDDYEGLFNQKRPKFEINAINEQLLTLFEKKGWITSFDIDKEDANYYRAYGRKAQKVKKPKLVDK